MTARASFVSRKPVPVVGAQCPTFKKFAQGRRSSIYAIARDSVAGNA